jgi:hypothetical protein
MLDAANLWQLYYPSSIGFIIYGKLIIIFRVFLEGYTIWQSKDRRRRVVIV